MLGPVVLAANRLICLICLFEAFVGAAPTIAFPINSQVPPVGRVLIPFTFIFSSSTFSSSSPMNYTLSNAPSWLNLDGITRTLYGVPPMSAANTALVIQITASDESGSVTMNTTLVISDHPAPVVAIPLEEQLSALGAYSPPSSILYHPSTSFQFSFNPRTFSQSNLNHYAITSDNTPLPAWITFDGATLSFSGRTPTSSSLIQPPQTWNLQLIASDVLGFAGTAINFNVVVGNHEFKFLDGLLNINATIGTPIEFTGLSGSLVLDGRKASISEIESISASTPDWLTFDNTTFGLSGIPPAGAVSYNVSITVVDIYQDIANATVHILISESIFVTSVGPFNATIGNPFTFNLGLCFLNTSDIIASVETAPPSRWLFFDSQTFILSGTVPSYIQPSTIQVSLKAVSKLHGVHDTRNFTLNIISSPIQTSIPTKAIPSSTDTVTSIETGNTIPAEARNTNTLSGGQIAAIVITPVLVVSAALLLCFFCFRRKKHRERQRRAPEKCDISRPMMTSSGDGEKSEISDKRVASSDTAINTAVYSRQCPPTLKRQSRSISSIQGGVSMYLRDSRSSGVRGRSYSENALSEFESSWRYTQDSAYPRMPVASVRNSTMRTTRNFSRKSSGPLPRESGPLGSSVGSTFNKEMTKPPRSSIQQMPNVAYDIGMIKKKRLSHRHTPNYLGFPDMGWRLSGLGHGSHTANSPLMAAPNWYTGEFELGTSGQTYEPRNYNIGIDEYSWLTIPGSTDVNEQHRQSAPSVLTELTELLNSPRRMTIRQVPKSPTQPSPAQVSLSGGFSQVGSRRLGGSSPFFAGSFRRGSRCTSRKSMKSAKDRYLHSCSPTTKGRGSINSTLRQTITHGFRDSENSSPGPGTASLRDRSTDPLGITYGSPGEGTRQLRDYVRRLSSYLSPSLRNSMQFSDSDSRFRSVESSPRSKHYEKSGGQREDHTFRYSHYGHTNGDNSPCSFNRDIYGMDGSPQLSEAIGAQTVTRPGVFLPVIGSSRSREAHSPVEVTEGRYMPNPGRPASSYANEVVREKSSSASHCGGVWDAEVDASLYGAFL